MNAGRWGERLAAWYLFFHGCRILDRNWRYGPYEIDIVARERRTGVLVFVLVLFFVFFLVFVLAMFAIEKMARPYRAWPGYPLL